MAKELDLGEIWSLVQQAPDFKVGDMAYVPYYDPEKKTLGALLLLIESVMVVQFTGLLLATGREIITDPKTKMNIPVWGTLGKARVQ